MVHLSGIVAFTLAILSLAPLTRAAVPASPIGRWLTQDGSGIIDIEPCGGASLCGRIVGVTLDHPGDPLPTDYQGHPQCMLTIVRDMLPDGASGWQGRIEDPRDGTNYDATMRVDEQHRLRLRGFIGIPLFGQTQIWTPYTGPVPADCRIQAKPR